MTGSFSIARLRLRVQSGNKCVAIVNQPSTSYQQINALIQVCTNPCLVSVFGSAHETLITRLPAAAIDNLCTTLIASQNICVGPPGGYRNFSAVPRATVTKTALYATAAAGRPDPVASGMATRCEKYHHAQLVGPTPPQHSRMYWTSSADVKCAEGLTTLNLWRSRKRWLQVIERFHGRNVVQRMVQRMAIGLADKMELRYSMLARFYTPSSFLQSLG